MYVRHRSRVRPPVGDVVHATVIGLGPAGRIAAHRAAARDWRVTAFDPAGGTMPKTIGAWAHQLPSWLAPDVVAARFRPSVITSSGRSRLLDDAYVILDTAALGRCGGFDIRSEIVSVEQAPGDIVIDARGTRTPMAARQLAYGQVFPEDAIPEVHRVPVLMDFTVPVGGTPPGCPASFSYRLPLGDGTWLIEETVPATRVTDASGEEDRLRLLGQLRHVQALRLRSLGVDAAAAVADETVDFALGPGKLSDAMPSTGRPPGHGAIGAGAGWMHPATGYSVGMVLAGIDGFLDALAADGRPLPPGGRPLAWLRRRGLHVLLGFDAAQTREFFGAFFTLPDAAIREYLTGTSAAKTMGIMIRLAWPLFRANPATLWALLASFFDGRPLGQGRRRGKDSYLQ